jgi:glycine cleavage system regulatory protein
MLKSLVLTIIGTDRPGLVEIVAQVVTQYGGNWVESRMSHLSGQFAGILHVSVPVESVAQLATELQALESQGLKVTIASSEDESTRPDFCVMQLDLLGNDRPGIMREVTQALASLEVNVEELQTECVNAPMSGGKLFQATAELRLPKELSESKLWDRLEKIAHDLTVDIRLHKVKKS